MVDTYRLERLADHSACQDMRRWCTMRGERTTTWASTKNMLPAERSKRCNVFPFAYKKERCGSPRVGLISEMAKICLSLLSECPQTGLKLTTACRSIARPLTDLSLCVWKPGWMSHLDTRSSGMTGVSF